MTLVIILVRENLIVEGFPLIRVGLVIDIFVDHPVFVGCDICKMVGRTGRGFLAECLKNFFL